MQLKHRIAEVFFFFFFFFFWYPSCFWGFSFEQSLLFIIHFLLGKLFSCLWIFVLNIFVSIVFFLSSFNAWIYVHRFPFVPLVDLCMDSFTACNFRLQVLLSFILRGILSIGSFYTCISCVRAFFRP